MIFKAKIMASKYIKNSSNFDNEIDDNFDINPMFGDSKFSSMYMCMCFL